MDKLDRWIPVSVLGSGAFGQVHLAWDPADLRWVAVKRFTGQDELGLLRFVIESRIRVDHPHLVRSLAFRLVDDDALLVTELARGGSLRQLMTRAGPLPAPWVATVIGQVLDALAALHAHGVVHRDLKPANLLLRDPGSAPPHVLVADFGIATWRTVSLTGVGAAIGTPGYLAPEYLDQSSPSPRTDLFAVGVVAAELLSGQRLIHQSSGSPEVLANWSSELPLPAGTPPKLAAVVRRMADPDPDGRYLDCVEAAQALRHALPDAAPGVVPGVDLLDRLPAGWTQEGPGSGPIPAQAPIGPLTPTQPMPPPDRPVPWSPPPVEPVTTQIARAPKRNRVLPVVLSLVVVALLAAGGIYWATRDRSVPGDPVLPTAPGQSGTPQAAWTPEAVKPCALAERGAVREIEGRRSRCQRTSPTKDQWVVEPAGGFPVSNPSGPFPGEACGTAADHDYSPSGVPVRCDRRKWVAGV